VAEQQERDLRLRTDFRCQLEDFRQTDTISERPFRASLYNRTIGNGIGKRHTQFDNIGAGLFKRKHQVACRLEIWITGRNIRNECLPPFFAKQVKSFLDTRHKFPRSRATSFTSLSPRPERLTTTILSFGSFTFFACATACELSSAGIMPSSRLNSANASS